MQVAQMLSLVCFFAVLSVAHGVLPATMIIRGYGYDCEEHDVLTADGWYLTMERIPRSHDGVPASKGTVLIQHGLLDSSVGVCLNSPTESLPFILADAGYDVWLGNNRGNGYSMNNTKYTPQQPQFWAFSFDEMATYDMPAQIAYALAVTGAETLTYIGHSEGTIQAFAGLTNTSVASKVNLFVALAPVAFVGHVGSKIFQVLAKFDLAFIEEMLGQMEFSLPLAIQKFLPGICSIDPTLCEFDLALLMGPSVNLNDTRLPYMLTYEPNPTSVLNMAHWSQMVRNDKFQKFDYGPVENTKIYGQPTPPQYDLSALPASLPIALFTGGEDYLADPTDVARMMGQLPGTPYVHFEPTYAHCDFIWAPDAATRIYPLILQLMKTHTV